jgi:hypothetical protein
MPASVPHNSDQPKPVYRLQFLADGEDGQHMVELPVFEPSQIQSTTWPSRHEQLVDELNRELAAIGCRLDRQTGFLSGRLHDGRQLVVPVHRTSLQYEVQ